MSRIKIKNFGPIREGFVDNDGWMDIEKVTVFIGDQGSGKSTVAKLISIFSWIEKSIICNLISVDLLNATIFKNLCAQQDFIEFFSGDSYLSYEGDAWIFEYDEQRNLFNSKINHKNFEKYVLPKIQYISAARNLLTILYNISAQSIIDSSGNVINLSSNIPFMVRELNSVYIKALDELAKDGFLLPISDTSVYYQNHNTFIVVKGKRVSMASASSGIQSITPLLLVSHFLSNEVRKDIYEKVQTIDNNLKNKIENDFSRENTRLSENFKLICSFGRGILTKREDVELLDKKLKKYIPSSFINIVEEPEQNLFPTSQQKVTNSLLEYNNAIKENKLVICTHSPYILASLNNSILADEVYKKTGKAINSYSEKKRVAYADVSAYMCENGRIISIKDNDSKLINADVIDSCSTKINSDFDELLDLLPENDD